MGEIGQHVQYALGVLRSFIGSVKATVHVIAISIDIDPEMGVADSVDIEFDLPELFLVIGSAAKAA